MARLVVDVCTGAWPGRGLVVPSLRPYAVYGGNSYLRTGFVSTSFILSVRYHFSSAKKVMGWFLVLKVDR